MLSIKYFFSKYDQMENFIFWVVRFAAAFFASPDHNIIDLNQWRHC